MGLPHQEGDYYGYATRERTLLQLRICVKLCKALFVNLERTDFETVL